MGDPDDDSGFQLALIVPRASVKTVKDALNESGRLDKSTKIKPCLGNSGHQMIKGKECDSQEARYYVPITTTSDEVGSLEAFTDSTMIQNLDTEISLVRIPFPGDRPGNAVGFSTNLLAQSVQQWLNDQSQRKCKTACPPTARILERSSWAYIVYPPLLLLSLSVYSNLSTILDTYRVTDRLPFLCSFICEKLTVSHIALNAPIFKEVTILSSEPGEPGTNKFDGNQRHSVPNILRSPTGLTPIYGDFGPEIPLDHVLDASDFTSAFWCTAQQNGVFQTWAPRYTMFSRGNISEKARLLQLDSLRQQRLGVEPGETSAVDLYAGIGYFAFSYVKAGVGKVLCWEINPWSIEGLRRGAERNKWEASVIDLESPQHSSHENSERILVFPESNVKAATRVDQIRGGIPPVKHVNCGYLPSSKDIWDVAVQVLDDTGGWIHAHENVAIKYIDARRDVVVAMFSDLLLKHRGAVNEQRWKVECEHIERIKSYAPGIIHCVFDVSVFPKDPG